MPCASAVADNQTDFEAQAPDVVEEPLTVENTDTGNFTDLNNLIVQSENELILDKDYKFNPSTDKDYGGFNISKDNYVVDGQGHTIDGSGLVRIFAFTGSNVTLKNITIINAKGTDGPAAYFTSLRMVDNCTFINNSASGSGGAIYIKDSVSDCKINSTFINNSAKNGGAIYFYGKTTNITVNGYYENNVAERAAGAVYFRGKSSNNEIVSEFYRNHAKAASGGAIFFYNLAENNKFESIFRYNTGAYGAGIFFYNKANNNSFDCDFRDNVAESCGGAMFFYNTSNNNNFTGYFINNSALGKIDVINGNGGAITFKDVSSNSIFTCDFINNTAVLYGGGVNYRQTPHNITFNSNFINNNAKQGGGVNFFENMDNVVFNGEFDDNYAEIGGAVAFREGVIENISFKNNHAEIGGAIFAYGKSTILDSEFYNNSAKQGGAIYIEDSISTCIINSKFVDNNADLGPSIFGQRCNITLNNTEFTSNGHTKGGQIFLIGSTGYIDNATFANIVSDYTPAIQIQNSKALTVLNSKFINLTAKISSGAIYVKNGGVLYIRNCEFTNTTSSKNAGAILADIAGMNNKLPGNVTILDTVFRNTSSEFGGAFIQFGGKLLINNTEFINNHATFNGGSVYISYVDYAEINDCNFTSNGVDIIENYPTYGGAMVIDMSTITINNSRFVNNTASKGNAIYAYDASYSIKNSLFENNTNAIYTFFDKEQSIENNTFINDNISLNNTFYASIQVGEGMQLTLLNNIINVDSIPKKFDLRDWGWVSPIKDQGWMGACWAFGMTGTLESALLKATGIEADLSENNMQNTMLRYSTYGITQLFEGGGNLVSISYLLSWLGAFMHDADTYDELGKLSPLITTNQDIHIQDLMFTPNNEIPNGTHLKSVILKYGSIDVLYNGQSTYNELAPYYRPDTYAQYINDSSIIPNHDVSIIGWDDNFPKENFGITPPGDGAWIVKNSWGPNWGDNGFLYVSYYDKTLLQSLNVLGYATSIIIENTVPYNKNYQYDMFWGGDFIGNGTVKYMNVFEALESDAIAAVGTYFNQSGVNYTVEIYVNDVLKLTQNGVSPYYGYHTIKLDNYIPIKEGDIFKAVITSNGMPRVRLGDSRMHYTNNISFISFDGETWEDAYDLGYIACLKVYTVALPIHTEDLVKIYKNDYQFVAKIGVANETVSFEINGRNYTRVTDENGNAKMNINLGPGNYTIKTNYNGLSVENNIEVLPTLIGENLVKYFRNASQFYVSLIDSEGKPVAGKNITMNINGVFYTKTTNENGTAKLNINLSPGEYILTATDPLTGLMMSYNITVLPTLNATDLEMTYKDGSTFNVTVLDGQGKPLANAKVTFNINGVFYNKISDSNGIARLNINLMPGEYIITSEYENLRISNKITIAAKDD